jgi:hypothetical protein
VTKEKKGGSDMIQVATMPKKGDVFKGKINDLCQTDAYGWRRRDISFFKQKVNGVGKFGYPVPQQKIILIDTDNERYTLNFSKPNTNHTICLGTPSRLKPWYRKKGFNEKTVGQNEYIYFEYTGRGIEFIILTELEYRHRL